MIIMKKNKLIELLQAVEGNPEILLWNGYVGDYMDIDKELAERSLVKMTFLRYIETIWMERLREDIREKHYSEKRIILINSKTRGEKTFDRWGEMSY